MLAISLETTFAPAPIGATHPFLISKEPPVYYKKRKKTDSGMEQMWANSKFD